ncbi:MAG: hypothetical protein C6W59_05120 [Paenibacillaceae bacterium]|jgi:uncharacterized SAM-binding protein YcdF (DUF218 family)|nr:MAG: hypothetical protein C6W59_05120 [Paenibacillaceae bacterium]
MKAAEAQAVRRRKRRSGLPARLLKTVLFAAVACAGWIAWIYWKIESFEPRMELPEYDAGIVLGAALWNGEPSPGLKERLDKAFELYREGRFRVFILTGGYDHAGSRLTEAEGMKRYLAALGVPEDRLLLEPAARSTYENLAFSRDIMEREGLRTALIVTHDFHAARARDVARWLGYEQPGFAAAESSVLPASQRHVREIAAFTKWKLDSVLLRIGLQIPDRPGL